MPRKLPLLRLALIAALCLASTFKTNAANPVWDSSATGGIQAGDGTWNFNTTSNWTLDGGGTRIPWSSNLDTALFQLQGTNGAVTVDNSNGAVGAAGIVVSGTTAGGAWTIGGSSSSLQIGAGGLTVNFGNDTSTLSVAAPVSLAGSQTWTSSAASASNGTSRVVIGGAISSASGTTNLTFDGSDRFNPANISATSSRVSFTLSGSNTFVGSTTVTGGAQLVLSYTATSDNRLDDSSALILSGGTILLNGGSDYVEVVGSTTINAGHNSIINGLSGGGGTTNHLQLGALTHNVGGTLDVTNANSDAVRTTATNTNGIVGGWATFGGSRFAMVNVAGVMVSATGSMLNTYSTWASTSNVFVTVAVNGSGDKTINTLRVAGGGSVSLNTGTTLTIVSGGIIGDSGTSISGGNLTSGAASGELFVHTPSALTISSAIVNNGSTPTTLVKAGTNTLTLSGTNSYTGGTYLNSGALSVEGSATIRGDVTEAGGATLTIRNGGTLSPGAAGEADAMSLGGNLTLSDGAILDFQLGLTSDILMLTNPFATLTGAASIGGVTLNISNAGGLVPATYTLMEWQAGTTLSGLDLTDFNVVTTGGISGNLQFGTNSVEYVVTAVPEPSSIGLILAGLVGVGAMRRRKRS